MQLAGWKKMFNGRDRSVEWKPAEKHKLKLYRVLVPALCLLVGYLLGRPSPPNREQWTLPEESVVQATEAQAQRVAEAQREIARKQEAVEAKRKEDERRVAEAEARLDDEAR